MKFFSPLILLTPIALLIFRYTFDENKYSLSFFNILDIV